MSESLDDARARLARLRQDSAAWAEVACADATDDEGRWTDTNAQARYAVLLALQYDLQNGDREIVRYLFEQEALRHRHEPFQGLFDALKLAGYQLASFRQVEHVWDFAQAKLANFDTYAGFGLQYVVSAGINETMRYVRASDHPMREDVLEWLDRDGACVISEHGLAEWWERQRIEFPARREDEPPQVRLDQALELGDMQEARRWLQVWEREIPRTVSMLSSLAWYWGYIEDWDRAAALTEERLALPELDTWGKAAGMVTLVEYQRRCGHLGEAWGTLQRAFPLLDACGDWWRAGLGRSAMEEALLLAQALVDERPDAARDAYAWAKQKVVRPNVATLHLLEIATATAALLGDEPTRERYAERARRERQRIERLVREVRHDKNDS